ncbi:MAG: hypothetical protein HKN82_18565 [Akkermansiaceae bacterium]|nr:hypothetical protein [Akkermansiaceae bacterium]NNM30554.1 hypothetical protein [Akkermansiaceae bacterium]
MNQPNSIEASLRVVATFFDKFGAPVEGHAREDLTREQRSQIERLAAGDLSDEERETIVPLLIRNEAAIELLAATVPGDR